MSENSQWFDRAASAIPGSVNSPVRAFGSVGGAPRFMVRGSGAWIEDVDGKKYVDLIGSWGPMILGHAHPAVIEAVQQTASSGLSFGTPGPNEVELAEEVIRRVAPVQKVRLVSSGTEATMSAIRLARGFTGRAKVLKFAGCYHGHVDALLASAGSGVATFALPDSAGVPESTTAEVIVVPYNDLDAVREAFAAHPGEIACIITEAVAANMGVVPPVAGFNRALADIAHADDALLISDEVMTGFRLSPAGMYGLDAATSGENPADTARDEVPSWAPDLMTFGKIIGGGLPVGAFGGRADIMDLIAPAGPVYQAGTLSGNPVTTAAGLATLRACDGQVYTHLDQVSADLRALVSDALTQAGVPHRVQHVSSLFSVFFYGDNVPNYETAKKQNTAAFAAFFHSMLDDGVHLPPSAFEAWFVSAAHDSAAMNLIAEALPNAARAAARALEGGK